MFGLSLGHLIIVGIVVLLFGHRRLPELGRALGSGVGAFKKGLEGKSFDNSSETSSIADHSNSKKISEEKKV